MKAMIFAAGLGTRLRPLTNDKPKAMVAVQGKPLLEHTILYLKQYGYTQIIVNVHHFAEVIIDFLKAKNNFGIDIVISDERGMLLETGGGLKKASWFLEGNDPFLVWNTDILSNIDLDKMRQQHLKTKAISTLALRRRETSRYLIFNKKTRLSGWTNIKTGEIKMARRAQGNLQMYAFSGIHMISPKMLPLLTQEGKFSIIKTYLSIASQYKVMGYLHTDDVWYDVGKMPVLEAVQKIDLDWI